MAMIRVKLLIYQKVNVGSRTIEQPTNKGFFQPQGSRRQPQSWPFGSSVGHGAAGCTSEGGPVTGGTPSF